MRRFVVIGRRATAAPAFSLIDVAGTSGRLDVLLRCIRASMLVSHGVRRDTAVDLVLLGGPRAPRVLRIEGPEMKFLRPDERSLAVLVQKALAITLEGPGFVQIRPGLSIAEGGLDVVLDDLPPGPRYVLEEGGQDVRTITIDPEAPVIFVGDHLGFDDDTRGHLHAIGAVPISVGPVRVHAEDAITLVANELDRAAHGPPGGARPAGEA